MLEELLGLWQSDMFGAPSQVPVRVVFDTLDRTARLEIGGESVNIFELDWDHVNHVEWGDVGLDELKPVVKVLDDGFELGDRIYRSLSAIAREVTDVKWNGLLFFRVIPYAKRPRKAA